MGLRCSYGATNAIYLGIRGTISKAQSNEHENVKYIILIFKILYKIELKLIS